MTTTSAGTGTNVLTRDQAKAITGGRTPLLPFEYEEAVRNLEACLTLDETKYWSDKADALAAWAKIYRSRDALLKAKRLKLKAFRRMGELAAELRPHKGRNGEIGGRQPGPAALLRSLGLTHGQADDARFISKIPKRQFNRIVSSDFPPSPSTVARRRSADTSSVWREIRDGQRNPFVCAHWCETNSPVEVARALSPGEIDVARGLAVALIEWLDQFEHALPGNDS